MTSNQGTVTAYATHNLEHEEYVEVDIISQSGQSSPVIVVIRMGDLILNAGFSLDETRELIASLENAIEDLENQTMI